LPAAGFALFLLPLPLVLVPSAVGGGSASMDLRRFVDVLSRLIVACGRSLKQQASKGGEEIGSQQGQIEVAGS
jgi:hypothetical protein